MEKQRRCTRCGVLKPVTEFWKNSHCRSGFLNQCKACVTKAPENVPRICLSCQKPFYANKYRIKSGRGIYCSRSCQAREAWRVIPTRATKLQRVRANSFVYNNLMASSSCEACQAAGVMIHGHHEDYNKPEEVRWLCVPCHRRLHLTRPIYASPGGKW